MLKRRAEYLLYNFPLVGRFCFAVTHKQDVYYQMRIEKSSLFFFFFKKFGETWGLFLFIPGEHAQQFRQKYTIFSSWDITLLLPAFFLSAGFSIDGKAELY